MKTNQVDSTNFQSRIRFDRSMSNAEKKYARAILNYKFPGEPVNTNRKLLRKCGLDLYFTGGKRFDSPSVGFKPQFTIFNKEDGIFKSVKTKPGREYIGYGNSLVWAGANKLRETLEDGNRIKADYDKDIVCNSLFKKIGILLKYMVNQ